MSVRLRYFAYGMAMALGAVAIGLFSAWQFDFSWVIVSTLLLIVITVLTLSNSYQRQRPMKRLPPNRAGATLVRSALSGDGGKTDPRTVVQPEERFKWMAVPPGIALPLVILIANTM